MDGILECTLTLSTCPPTKFAYQCADFGISYNAAYNYVSSPSCEGCSKEEVVRVPRDNTDVLLHFGTIASGNQVMKDSATRDRLSKELGCVQS